MKSNFDIALAFVLKSEGGFVNNPKDPGGMTNLGVTKAVWEDWVGHPVDQKTMENLTPELVSTMYKPKYWDRSSCDSLPTGIDYVVFDTAVNSGPGRAVKLLQGCVGVTVDGSLGPMTLGAVNDCTPEQLIEDYCKARLAFLSYLPTWETFGKGWTNRVNDVHKNAISML